MQDNIATESKPEQSNTVSSWAGNVSVQAGIHLTEKAFKHDVQETTNLLVKGIAKDFIEKMDKGDTVDPRIVSYDLGFLQPNLELDLQYEWDEEENEWCTCCTLYDTVVGHSLEISSVYTTDSVEKLADTVWELIEPTVRYWQEQKKRVTTVAKESKPALSTVLENASARQQRQGNTATDRHPIPKKERP